MEELDPPLHHQPAVDAIETLVGPCLDVIQRLRRVNRQVAYVVREAIEENIPGMALAMAEALVESPDISERRRGAVRLPVIVEHDPDRGFEIADRLMGDDEHVAMEVADSLQFAADMGGIDRDRVAALRARHPRAWWPD